MCSSHGQLGNELKHLFYLVSLKLGYSELFVDPDVDYTDLEELDITSSNTVNTWFDQHDRYDLVINCACATNVDGCSNFRISAGKAHLRFTMNLARACSTTQTKA